jgi:hypothetical protein
MRGGHISEASAVFTDRPLPSGIANRLAADGVRVVIATSSSH